MAENEEEVYADPSALQQVVPFKNLIKTLQQSANQNSNKAFIKPVSGISQATAQTAKKPVPIPPQQDRPDVHPKPISNGRPKPSTKPSSIANRASLFGDLKTPNARNNNFSYLKPVNSQCEAPALQPKQSKTLLVSDDKRGSKPLRVLNEVVTASCPGDSELPPPPQLEVSDAPIRNSFPPPPDTVDNGLENLTEDKPTTTTSQPYSPVKASPSVGNKASGYEDFPPPRPPKNSNIRLASTSSVNSKKLTTSSNVAEIENKSSEYKIKIFVLPTEETPLKPAFPDNVQISASDFLIDSDVLSDESILRKKEASTKRRLPSVPPTSVPPTAATIEVAEDENPDYECVEELMRKRSTGNEASAPTPRSTSRQSKAVSRIKSMTEEEENEGETYDAISLTDPNTRSSSVENKEEQETYEKI